MTFRMELAPFEPVLLNQLATLSGQIFGDTRREAIDWRLSRMPDASVVVAASDGVLVAFKAGYAMSESKYYSWLGGVHPDHRRRGLAGELMRRQHTWLAGRGYAWVETAATNTNQAMVGVNLQHGFSVCGMRVKPGDTQLLFLKALTAD